jgi:uridine phosphorylase
VGWPLAFKLVPLADGPLFAPNAGTVIFVHDRTVSVWDGQLHRFTEPGLGYTDLFTASVDLTDIAPMRSGDFLVAGNGALIEFNLRGKVGEYTFPGAQHIELLADQCTLLYTSGDAAVHRFNICSSEVQSDFAALIPGESAGAIRQLPNGDVLVADGSAILQFDARGSLLYSYQFPGVTHLALTADGANFWAAGVFLDKAELRLFSPITRQSQSIQFGNDEMQTIIVPVAVTNLAVVGEWRAATISRGRAFRHF